MAIVFEGNQDPFGIKAIGDPLIKALQARTDRNRQQQQNIAQGGILNNVMSQIREDSSMVDILKAITQGKQQGLTAETLKQFEPYFKSLAESDPFRHSQQGRLQKEATSTMYNRAIKEIDNALEKRIYPYGSQEYVDALDARKRLVEERDSLLGLGKTKQNKKKVKFDIKNPGHKAARDKALEESLGNQEQAEERLNEDYEL